MLTDGRDILMHYLCAKYGDFSFSSFDFIVRTNTHTHMHTDAAKHLTPAIVVGVSNSQWIAAISGRLKKYMLQQKETIQQDRSTTGAKLEDCLTLTRFNYGINIANIMGRSLREKNYQTRTTACVSANGERKKISKKGSINEMRDMWIETRRS